MVRRFAGSSGSVTKQECCVLNCRRLVEVIRWKEEEKRRLHVVCGSGAPLEPGPVRRAGPHRAGPGRGGGRGGEAEARRPVEPLLVQGRRRGHAEDRGGFRPREQREPGDRLTDREAGDGPRPRSWRARTCRSSCRGSDRFGRRAVSECSGRPGATRTRDFRPRSAWPP